MDEHAFKKFIDTEAKIIQLSKWLAGEKLGRDPGEAYVADWIKKHAEELRAAWNLSKCFSCKKNCLHNLKIYCEDYEQE